ncbi:MAG: hypothetical protein J5821_03340 [Alphaproteobacteria bacterium]|nr:hypothetical protein [Alphaproteobacteria bacterium]
MGKKFAILSCVFGLLAGCVEMDYTDPSSEEFAVNSVEKNLALPDVHVASREDISIANFVLENILRLSFDDNYFMEAGQNFKITSPYGELEKKVVKNDLESHRITTIYNATREDNCISGKLESDEKSAYVRCCYLGRLNGKHVIMRAYNTGGSGTFTDIVQCSIEKENLHIEDISMLGDRAFDGIVDCPRLGRDGKLYLKMRTSIYTFAEMAGVSDKDIKTGPFQASQDFWNVSKCIYDLRTKKLEIVSVDIDFTDMNFEEPSTSDVAKILKMIFPSHGKTVRIEKDNMPEFLRKFKSAYLKLAQTSRTKYHGDARLTVSPNSFANPLHSV